MDHRRLPRRRQFTSPEELHRWLERNPVRGLRLERRWTQTALATVSETSETTVRALETGVTRVRGEAIRRIAASLGDPGLVGRWEQWIARRPRVPQGGKTGGRP